MADCIDKPSQTDKPKKRKSIGRTKDIIKKQKLSSHTTGDDCKCTRLQCFEVVSEENRRRLIDHFNSLETKDQQDSYLSTLITVSDVQRRRPRNGETAHSNDHSYTYYVFVKNDGMDQFAQVCYKALQSIFGIKRGRLDNIKKSLATKGEPPRDQRGKHHNRPHAITDVTDAMICQHIESFHGRQSHYSQDKTRHIYLPEDLNVAKMHKLFRDEHPNQHVSYDTYRNIFNTKYNISFGYPRTVTCSKCDMFKEKIKTLTNEIAISENSTDVESLSKQLREIDIQKQLHHKKAETFYERKRIAKEKSKSEETYKAIAFDFQKNLNVPNKQTNDFYYKQKLTLHSFNIHVLGKDDVFIYAYDETTAKKGANEVGSMLYHFIHNYLSPDVRNVEFFCDSCGGQNKNYTIIRLCEYLVNQEHRFDSIKISFPERGHSYLECDRDMGLINCKSPINVPDDWYCAFRIAREKPSPYMVVEASQDMFLNFEAFLKPRYKPTNPVATQPLREIKFSIQFPGAMQHRDNWNGSISKSFLCCRKKSKQSKEMDIIDLVGRPAILYKDRIPISAAKFNDLQVLKQFTSNPQFFDNLSQVEVVENFHEVVNV